MMNLKSFGFDGIFLSAGFVLSLGTCEVLGQDLPGAAETTVLTPPRLSAGTSIWTNPPKIINPATRDPQLEALPAAPNGTSIIRNPATDMDQGAHSVVCTSDESQQVTVVGNDFRMRCQTLHVYFNVANKIDHLVADGNVVIEQPDRLTKAGHAVFLETENKITLTHNPEIYDDGRHIQGDIITIYRAKNTMNVLNSVMVIPESSATPSTTPAPAPQ